ncbi:type I-C CRISPR-associated protein Cas7/Csd2 [Actinokineospora bangkokensis]|uniref:Type I-C CRISPR-associated protein Cas7/Csd2 n=1 Tax=Actinokineospora bangkokensis TaxID=1193682 RepID=A0A1Q9LKM3_9PSEU|nr:type I-C CRISPR-associated protein Cas7/Csd2 [Actinokineospora bangkokensis]OLR92570.1 type I-C CRISPR-associated protein Cas7/Csd2 [Actinokineospora bangkokensis]
MNAPHLDPTVRHDIVFLFDVTDGNPNGDPDAGNRPRTDDESGQGLVTDVALKRKIRDTLALAAPGEPRYGIFVEAGHALNPRLEASYTATGLTLGDKKITEDKAAQARAWLCDRYVDLRLFGGVLSVGNTGRLGQIRGPLQVGMARSIDPVLPTDHTITRVTQTKQADIDKGETTEIGSKWTVPYGLYRTELYYSATRGSQTGVDTRDLELLHRCLEMMFDHDRSATRGRLAPRGLYVFSHSDAFGAAPAHRLLERVHVTRPDTTTPARAFTDYTVSIDDDGLPTGVTLTKLIA